MPAPGVIHRVLVAPTASGKKGLAAELAERHGLALLSMDSMKVYRGMDVGTDKPSAELRARVRFGLIDLVGHDEPFSAGAWVEAAKAEVARADRPVLFSGGTPLYLRLLLRGLFEGPPADPELRGELDALWEREGEAGVRERLRGVDPEIEARLLPGDRKRLLRALEVQRLTGEPLSALQRTRTRPPIAGEFRVAALHLEEGWHRRRIRERVERMLERGLVDEVRGLAARAPLAPEPARAIGYREALEHLAGGLDAAAMLERIDARTRRLVRKQRTFVRSFEERCDVEVDEGCARDDVLARLQAALGLGRAVD